MFNWIFASLVLIISQQTLSSVVLDGEYVDRYGDDSIKSLTQYVNGEKTIELGFYNTGEREYLTNYELGVRSGSEMWFYKNGKIRSKATFKKGKKEGESITFFENGSPESQLNYKSDKLDGVSIWYYESGEVMMESEFTNDKKDGYSIEYFKSKEIKDIFKYRNGIVDDSASFNNYNSDVTIYNEVA